MLVILFHCSSIASKWCCPNRWHVAYVMSSSIPLQQIRLRTNKMLNKKPTLLLMSLAPHLKRHTRRHLYSSSHGNGLLAYSCLLHDGQQPSNWAPHSQSKCDISLYFNYCVSINTNNLLEEMVAGDVVHKTPSEPVVPTTSKTLAEFFFFVIYVSCISFWL